MIVSKVGGYTFALRCAVHTYDPHIVPKKRENMVNGKSVGYRRRGLHPPTTPPIKNDGRIGSL